MMERQSEMQMLKLCPVDEEGLNDLAEDLILLLQAPLRVLPTPDRKVAEAKMKLGRMIIKVGNCIGVNQLSGISLIESLYKDLLPFASDNPLELCDCVIVGKQLIISAINNKLKSCLLKQVLRNIFSFSDFSEASDFLFLLWSLKDQISLSTETLEEFIQGYPDCLEAYLLDIIKNVISSEEGSSVVWNDDLISFCKLCSESPKLFQIVLTVLHELLLLSDTNKLVLNFIQTFVYHTQLNCKNTFVDLFPESLHLLVTFLQIKPTLYPDSFFDSDFTRSNALKNLLSLLCRDLRVGTALLCYYPEWILHLFNYCAQNDISKFIPNFKITDKTSILYLQFLVRAIPFA